MVISYAIITPSFIQKDLMSEDKKKAKTKKTRLKIPVLKLLTIYRHRPSSKQDNYDMVG